MQLWTVRRLAVGMISGTWCTVLLLLYIVVHLFSPLRCTCNTKLFLSLVSLTPGYPRVGIRLEGSATTAAEAHDSAAAARGHAHTVSMAMLRCWRALYVRRHLENTPGSSSFTSLVSIILWHKVLVSVAYLWFEYGAGLPFKANTATRCRH